MEMNDAHMLTLEYVFERIDLPVFQISNVISFVVAVSVDEILMRSSIYSRFDAAQIIYTHNRSHLR